VSRARRIRHLALFAAILYLAVLWVSPLFHHDFDCHAKSPAHCPSCMANPAAVDSKDETPLARPLLLAAEEPAVARLSATAPLLVGSLKDRSPPA
jgi:hypothetical protein